MNDNGWRGCTGCPYGLKCPCGSDCSCRCKMPPEQLRVDTYTTGKASAVRVMHTPSGLVAESQDEVSPFRNREVAIQSLWEKVSRLPSPPR